MKKREIALGGYTIVETLVFLAISGMLIAAAVTLVGGKQVKTEFNQAVGDFVSNLQSVANDVSTGYSSFPFESGDKCKVQGKMIKKDGSEPSAGQQRCIFIGRVIQMASGSNAENYTSISVVGNQYVPGTGAQPETIVQANPVALAPGTGVAISNFNASENFSIGYGLKITGMKYYTSLTSAGVNIGSFGFFSTFNAQYTYDNRLATGESRVQLVPIRNDSSLSRTDAAAVDAINNSPSSYSVVDPEGGIKMCLSGGGNQEAMIKIGGSGGQQRVTSQIGGPGSCVL